MEPEKPASQKFTHAEVGYEHPSTHSGAHNCSHCIHYIVATPPRCEGVKSPIRPEDWCRRWRRG